MEERKRGFCYRAIIIEKRTAELDSEVRVKTTQREEKSVRVREKYTFQDLY